MGQLHDARFPGESDAYRTARDKLLAAEVELRKQIADVAALRQELPRGGALAQDYIFDEHAGGSNRQTRFSDLFDADKDVLAVYSLMYAPGDAPACPACTSVLDGLNGTAKQIGQRINFAVVARAPIDTLRAYARDRGWANLRLLSSADNTYNADYNAQRGTDHQLPILNVFRRTGGGIFHTYATELLFAPAMPGTHPRHVDALWPMWNMLDMTPIGRGTDWFPNVC